MNVNTFYTHANDYMDKSWEQWEKNELAASWGYSLSARLAYLADVIANVVIFPLAILRVTFGLFHGLLTWNWNK